MVAIKLDKKKVINGLRMGFYTKNFTHSNPSADLEDLDDISHEDHTIYISIDNNYNITRVKSFFGESPTSEDRL